MKYERAAKELEFTKRRLQTQHEHDLEQLIGLKKQLEKKLADAYEEVEEQRQVVGQWKRKHQKLSSEMNDLRMLLEEQNGRNNLLEKRQRKFDSECQALQVCSYTNLRGLFIVWRHFCFLFLTRVCIVVGILNGSLVWCFFFIAKMSYFIVRQDASRQERQAKDRLSREKDVLIAEKFGLEQSLAVSLSWIYKWFIL